MKKLLVAILAVSLLSAPAFAANGGGKKKAKKKAKIESKMDNACDPANCDPKCCDLSACTKDQSEKNQKCVPTTSCTATK